MISILTCYGEFLQISTCCTGIQVASKFALHWPLRFRTHTCLLTAVISVLWTVLLCSLNFTCHNQLVSANPWSRGIVASRYSLLCDPVKRDRGWSSSRLSKGLYLQTITLNQKLVTYETTNQTTLQAAVHCILISDHYLVPTQILKQAVWCWTVGYVLL